MTKYTQLIAGLLIFVSCSQQEKNAILIETEWIYAGDHSKSLFDSLDIGLSFRDDSLFTSSDRGLLMRGRYYLNEDKLRLYSNQDTIDWTVKITQDSLTILKDDEPFKYYHKKLEFDPQLQYRKIILQTGICFGDCPEFKVTFDDKGTMYFERLKNGNVTETKNYVTDDITTSKIDSLFKLSNISKIDSSRYYGWSHDWDMAIEFEYGKGEVRKIKGTLGHMPYRLKPIIGTLISDLKKRELIK
jgi:hypothetical protein